VNLELVVGILAAAVLAGSPILYATLGEIVAERAGILNLGIEGMMLVGAVTGFMVVQTNGDLVLAVLAAGCAGGLLSLVHAFLAITLRANQIVSGLALTIFGTGVSAYLGKSYIGVPAKASFRPLPLPGLGDLPIVGPVLFQQNVLVYALYALVPLMAYVMYRTRPGLHLRAVGEDPSTADAMGVNVFALRYLCTFLGGVLAGLGGAFLSLAYAPSWIENMTGGRGWIAVALVIFAAWDPVRAMMGAVLFGGVEALQFRLQAMGVQFSYFFLQMLPYIFTIVVLIFATQQTMRRRIGAPAALGVPYVREERR
jgi:simple sugar transport system permease protein